MYLEILDAIRIIICNIIEPDLAFCFQSIFHHYFPVNRSDELLYLITGKKCRFFYFEATNWTNYINRSQNAVCECCEDKRTSLEQDFDSHKYLQTDAKNHQEKMRKDKEKKRVRDSTYLLATDFSKTTSTPKGILLLNCVFFIQLYEHLKMATRIRIHTEKNISSCLA